MGTSKLHVAMFPWSAYGHFFPFLYLSSKLAERGHRVSYLLPTGVKPKLEKLNHHPDLIKFFTLSLPPVDGLPPGAETVSDIPFSLQGFLTLALYKTQPQVETILATLKPDIVFFDFQSWLPAITRPLGAKSIYFSVVTAATHSLFTVPARKMAPDTSVEELLQPPPGYPSLNVVLRANDKAYLDMRDSLAGSLGLYELLTGCFQECDAIAFRSCQELEGPYFEYFSQQYSKPVLTTGHMLPKTSASRLEDKWDKWLNKFEPGSVVYCAFGSQITLEIEQFQELLLGFELSGFPFLMALTPPHGCSTVEEALPEGFKERVGERAWVDGGWVPQTLILKHPSVGCFVNHCGFGSMWESLVSDCQIVLIPFLADQALGTRIMVEELKVAIEVERGVDGMIGKEALSKAIKSVMDEESELGNSVKNNHVKWKNIFSSKDWQDEKFDGFVRDLQCLLESGK